MSEENVLSNKIEMKKVWQLLGIIAVTALIWNRPITCFGIEGLTVIQQRVIAIFVFVLNLNYNIWICFHNSYRNNQSFWRENLSHTKLFTINCFIRTWQTTIWSFDYICVRIRNTHRNFISNC